MNSVCATSNENLAISENNYQSLDNLQNENLSKNNSDIGLKNNSNENNEDSNSENTAQNSSNENQDYGGYEASAGAESFTIPEITDAATWLKNYINTNHVLPTNVPVGSTNIDINSFLYLLSTAVLNINNIDPNPIESIYIGPPQTNKEVIQAGNMGISEYIKIAQDFKTYMDTYGIVPGYAMETSLGHYLSYMSIISIFCNVLDNYTATKVLPDKVQVKPWFSEIGTVRGVWVWSTSLSTIDPWALMNAGYTDAFVFVLQDGDYISVLKQFIDKFSGTNIRIHAWITCFAYNGKWWIAHDTARQETVKGLIYNIIYYCQNYKQGIAGIHLDYVRYSGVASLNRAAYQQSPHGKYTVTNFVKDVYNLVKGMNPNLYLSAAVMPECGSNADLYGQDYALLSPYLDIMTLSKT